MKRNWPRRLTIAAILAVPAAVVLWLATDRALYKERFSSYSVYRTANDGMSIAYRYLSARREQAGEPGVNVLSRPLEFAQVPDNATLFRVAPNFVPAAKRKKNDPDEFGRKTKATPAKPPPATNPPVNPGTTPAPPGTPPAGTPPAGTPPVPGVPPAVPPVVTAPAAPEEKQAELLTPYETTWVEKGGRLVLAVHSNHGPVLVEGPTSYEKVQRIHPMLTGIHTIQPMIFRRLEGWMLGQSHTLLASGSDVLAARWTLGKGEVILLTCPEIFRNDQIGTAQHMPLLEILAGGGRPIYFDEMVHGLRTDLGVIELLTRWGLGPLIGLGLLFCILIYWRQRMGIGPPVDNYRETRREAVDLVDSMAAVYQRELPRWEALEIYHKELKRDAALTTEHRGHALDEYVLKLMRGHALPVPTKNKDLTQQQLEQGLDVINEAFRRLHDAKSRSAVR